MSELKLFLPMRSCVSRFKSLDSSVSMEVSSFQVRAAKALTPNIVRFLRGAGPFDSVRNSQIKYDGSSLRRQLVKHVMTGINLRRVWALPPHVFRRFRPSYLPLPILKKDTSQDLVTVQLHAFVRFSRRFFSSDPARPSDFRPLSPSGTNILGRVRWPANVTTKAWITDEFIGIGGREVRNWEWPVPNSERSFTVSLCRLDRSGRPLGLWFTFEDLCKDDFKDLDYAELARMAAGESCMVCVFLVPVFSADDLLGSARRFSNFIEAAFVRKVKLRIVLRAAPADIFSEILKLSSTNESEGALPVDGTNGLLTLESGSVGEGVRATERAIGRINLMYKNASTGI
jgi:hypothetical protein